MQPADYYCLRLASVVLDAIRIVCVSLGLKDSFKVLDFKCWYGVASILFISAPFPKSKQFHRCVPLSCVPVKTWQYLVAFRIDGVVL